MLRGADLRIVFIPRDSQAYHVTMPQPTQPIPQFFHISALSLQNPSKIVPLISLIECD